MDVIVRDGSIVDVAPAADAKHSDGAHVIDATGKYVIPGLIDMHAHLQLLDPTLMAMHTKFWGDDPRYTKDPDLALVPEIVREGWPAGRRVFGSSSRRGTWPHRQSHRLTAYVSESYRCGSASLTARSYATVRLCACATRKLGDSKTRRLEDPFRSSLCSAR